MRYRQLVEQVSMVRHSSLPNLGDIILCSPSKDSCFSPAHDLQRNLVASPPVDIKKVLDSENVLPKIMIIQLADSI